MHHHRYEVGAINFVLYPYVTVIQVQSSYGGVLWTLTVAARGLNGGNQEVQHILHIRFDPGLAIIICRPSSTH